MNTFFKKNLSHVIAIFVFLAITVAYLSPMFFENKVLMGGDVVQGLGGSQELKEYQKQTGEISLWTNALFSGMPSIMVYTNYPGNLTPYISSIVSLKLPRIADMIFLSLVGFYLLLTVYGVRTILAIAGAFAFTFATYTIVSIEAGHNAKVNAMAYMPVVLAGLVLAYRKNIWWGSLILAIGLALNILTTHVQITFYTLLISLIFVVSEFIYSLKEKQLKRFFMASGVLAVAAAIGVGTHASYLISVTEYGQYSIRGKSELKPKTVDAPSDGLDKDYAFDWSYSPAETMTFLIPRFYGGSSNENVGKSSNIYETLTSKGVPANSAKDFAKALPTYWGDLPFTSGPLYIGAIIIFLAVLGLLVLEGRYKYWLLAGTLLSLFLSWGKNFETFNYFLFDYVPLFNKFRAVMMAVVIAQITLPLLAMITLEKIVSEGLDKVAFTKKLFIALGVTGGVCALIFVLSGTFDFTSEGDPRLLESFKSMTGDAGFAQQIMDAILADRESLMRSDALRSLVFIALAGGLIFLYINHKIKETIAVIGISVLVFLDLWTLDKNYLNTTNFNKKGAETYLSMTAADEAIKRDTSLSYRVLNLSGNPFTENRTSYFHKSIGGNNPAKLRRYQDLIEAHLSKNNEKVLNMLNAKYAIISPEQPPQLIPGALGNAWFVQEIKKVNSPDEEIAALEKFEPAYTAVVDVSKFAVKKEKFDTTIGTINLQECKPNYLKYTSKSTSEKLAVFSEIYYPQGWTVTIDGQPAELLRANYVLRALYVPAGTHTIEMKFDLPSFHTGNKISYACSILLFIGIAGVIAVEVIQRKKNNS